MDDVRTSGFADPLRKQSFFFLAAKILKLLAKPLQN